MNKTANIFNVLKVSFYTIFFSFIIFSCMNPEPVVLPQFNHLIAKGVDGQGDFEISTKSGSPICVMNDSIFSKAIQFSWEDSRLPLAIQIYYKNSLFYPNNDSTPSNSGVIINFKSNKADSIPYEFKIWKVGGSSPIIEGVWFYIISEASEI